MTKITQMLNRWIFLPLLTFYCVLTTDPNIILSSKENYKDWIIRLAKIKKGFLKI